MTKKDFRLIAECIAEYINHSKGKEGDIEGLIWAFNKNLSIDNYRFDLERFTNYIWACLNPENQKKYSLLLRGRED